ncbi:MULTISPECIES: diacylglycerol kinase [Gammaproteobacteria]|uniref:diacylglycerol kinase n=1 Tax=Gammaproteobacteria TaxID=1236 RepID=UPI00082360E4|nr:MULTISPECIES: diacylglycerol kinase [Gammaproteobacteria]EGZ6887521.1 diacylglycerol kinase [Vibrio cholerae]MBU5699471.1 diacylglycerol kinase [Vibrio cholerae]MDV2348345.1 diacylglycerol kinase [Vibrio cholerae]NOE51961.1 diacylglycerol kinase [Vibrio cholerae]OCW94833.1 diacylglycerol kinase [Alishewanella sp. HH-ZS]
MKNHHTGWRRLLSAAHYSKQGFISSWRSEAAIRQEIVALCFLVPIAFIVEVSPVERALLILSLMLVLVVELLNTGIEAVVDRIGAEHHVLSGKAKDVGSAAVLTMLVLATMVWVIILF